MAFVFFQRIATCLFFIFLFQFNVHAQLPACKDSFPTSLLLNNSFEQYSGCSSQYAGSLEGGYIDEYEQSGGIKVNNWHSFLHGFNVHYFNMKCRSNLGSSIFDTGYFDGNSRNNPKVPLPLPDSSGFIATTVYNAGYGPPGEDYITYCLASPLYAQQKYVFSFYFGFGTQKYGTESSPHGSPSPFTLAIFGRQDCPDYPLQPTDNGLYQGCLVNQPGWALLGFVMLTGKNEWVQGNIEFTPQTPISCIGIGPYCEGGNLKDTQAVYYMDKFILAPKPDFSFKNITAVKGNVCTGHFQLEAPEYDNATYQWYKDRHAIAGANSRTYAVPDVPGAAGAYQANISLPYNTCLNTLPYTVEFSDLQNFHLGNDTSICAPSSIRINTLWTASQFLWQDGSTKSFYDVTQSGTYSVKLTDQYGCTKSDAIKVNVENCSICDLFVPSAFTPNNDRLNDVFRVLPKCQYVALQRFKLNIYNRWGQLIYVANDINESWDGTFKSQPQSAGVYVYYLEYQFKQNPIIKKKGTIELLR